MAWQETVPQVDTTSFDVKDRLGRTIGAVIYTWEETLVALPPDATSWITIPPGTYQVLRCQTTRNGASYGPYQGAKRFHTVADRDAEIQRYLKYARKAAIKREGK